MLVTDETVQSKWGFYQFKNPPTEKELSELYTQRYYQCRYGDAEEIPITDEIRHKIYIDYLVAKHALDLKPDTKTLFDVGCGEGFMLAEFEKLGIKDFKCADFSSKGLSTCNPQLLDKLIQGDFYTCVKEEFQKNKFDMIVNTNVIEHVTDPESLLKLLISGMHENSILIIRCPNDFSPLHKKLMNEDLINRQWWVSYPDHLAYFNKENMTNFLDDHNLEVVSVLGDYPIDLFLLNEDLNYINEPPKGRIAHKQRIKTDLFLSEFDADKVINLYKAYADLGLGRNLAYFCKLKSSK